jgi:cytochrome c-type biogenesis protein CcmF
VGVTVIGIAATGWSVESLGTLRVGDHLAAGPYEAKLIRMVPRTGPNYREDVLTLAITHGGSEVGSVDTMKRMYLTRGMPTTEAGIITIGVSQVYASVGEVQADGAVGIRLFYKPLILLIWLGGVVMAFGGAISLTDRRLRVGAPARARTPAAMPAAAE